MIHYLNFLVMWPVALFLTRRCFAYYDWLHKFHPLWPVVVFLWLWPFVALSL